MEDIEYLDEYKDLVLPGIKSSAPPASAGVPRQRRISSDSSSSSSIDADIFQKLFHGKYLDDELLKEGSGSKSQDRRRRPPSSSSSDESNDALEALFCGKSSQSKLSKRRERYESFDSVDDLGEALMRPSHRLTVPKPSTSQAGSKKSQDAIPHRSISNSSSGNIAMSSGHTFASPKNKKTNSVANKTAVSANGDKGTSSKNKTVTIVKPQKKDLRPSRLEPKTDPLTLGNLYGDSDSDSSYEYESDFYGDQDSDEEDEPVIDISTDTSRTTSVADTVTPVVSDDEGQEPQSELNQRPENDKESFLSSTYERLQSYLSNLSSAEAPPIYKKQNSARKSRSNEKKPSSFQQVKHANERTAASDKEANKKERDLEPPEASSCAKSSASKASGSRKLYEVDNNATLEAVERMSLDLAEQILKIDVERSYEFEKRSGSKSRSLSRSKIPADSSTSQMDHVRKLTYSSERLDQPEPLGTQLRRSKSESLPKRGRPRGQKQRKIRAATTEEKSPNVRDGEGEPVKRKRGRPRKIIPKEEPTTAETANPIESLNTNVPLSIDTSKGNPETERVNLEVPTKQDEPISELDNAKELTGSTNLSQDDIKMASSHQETDQKCAPDRVALDKSESAPKVEQEPHCKVDTPTETFNTALDESKVSESAKNHIKSEDKGLSSDKEKTQKESRNGNSKETNDNENSVKVTNEVELPVDMAEAKAVSGNILEEGDSQLAEDFKLAEEILAAEVGKGVEANEVPVTSVQGEQNPVIEIVKELEQETIPPNHENQSSVEDQTLADEENPVENQSPVKEPSSSKDEPPAEEHSPGPDQTPVAKNKQHDKEHNEASQAESLPGSDDPSSSGTPSNKQNHSSPANTPKKSKEIEALQSSVPRRALRSDKATPQNQRESRSKRTLKSELTLLMDDTMRRSSPRLGRSPAESHSSQERSPMEKKVTVSKLAKDLITIEKAKVIELKSLPDASETMDVKITKTTTASDTSILTILTDENPSSSKTEQKKLKGKALKVKKMSSTEVKKAISDSNEDIPSSSSIKCVDSSESEPKDEKEEILCPKPPIDCTNTDLEQSTAIETDTEQVEEKRSNRRKSRRIRNEKFKTETDTLSDHSDVKKAEKVPLETQQSDPVTAKKERNSGRLSRKEKSVINADKSEKDESPSSKSQSTERTLLLNENPSKKDKKTEQSDNTNEAVVGPIDKTETSKSRNIIDKKSNKSSDSVMQPSDRLNHKESASIKLSSKSSPEKIMQDQDKKLDALNDGGDSDPTIKDTGEDSRQTDKEHEENNTKHEEEGTEPISKDSSQDSAKPRLSKTKSRNKGKKNEKKTNDSIAVSDIEGAFGTETVQATCSTSSEAGKKDMVKSDETNEEANLSETKIDHENKLDAVIEGGDLDPNIRDTVENRRQINKKRKKDDTKNYEETILNTDETKYSSGKDSENISKHFSQDSSKLKPSKAKSRNKRKKSEQKPSDGIAESDIEGALDVNAETVQATCSTSSQSNKKDMVKSGEKSEEPNLSETEIGRIRKRRQAVTIENTKDDFQITPQNENQSIAGFNSEEQVPRPESVDSSDTPIMKIPTKTYLMCTKHKTSLLTASEDPDTVPEQQKLITTTKGDSNTVSDVLTTEAPDLDDANNLETSSSQDPKEHGFSDKTLTDNSDIIPSCTKKSQIVVPTTPTKSSDQTNSFITPNRSVKSKGNASKETKKSDCSFEESQKAASESSASKEQKELRTPTASCRKLRVLIKRTPTSNLPTNSRKSIFKKSSTKSKRLSKILEIMEKRPSSEQCDNKPLVSSDEINPDSDPVAAESLPVAILHDSDRDLETNKIQNEEVFEDTEVASAEETDNKSKKKEDDHELEVNDIFAASENRITDDSTKDASLNKATDSDVLQETKDQLSNSLINAIQDEDTPIKKLPEEEVPNDKTAKDESEKQEILKDLESDNAPLEEASAPTAKAAEEVDLYIKDKSNVKSVVAEPETDVTDDEFLVQSPIPNSSETTSVTDDPEPSTSSMVKRSLRKREADSSQPDAAKRKQRQDVEKSLTGKKKPARRRQLAEVEERASHKRSKTELEAKSTVQGKYISIIGNETIMSSTTAPIRDTKSEAASTSPSARKPAVQESKHVETTKHIILGPPGKKLLHLDSPAAEVKKPMVQTLLSSTLSLQKPSTVEDGSPLKIRKSVKKSIADENIDGDQSILSSSSVLNKNTSAVAPRKVNISVSLLQSKDTQVGTTASSSKTPILTKKEKFKTQKSTKKSEDNTKTESKKKSLVQGPQMKTQKSEEGLSGPKILNKSLKSETEFSKKTVSAVTGRKQIGQLEVSKKLESRKSEGSLLESNPRKKQSQVQRISKMDSRKSEGTSLTQPEVSKSETALKAALPKEAEFPVQDAEIEKMSKGRVHQNAVKNTKTEQPKSKTKTEVRSLEAEAAIDPMDSMNFQSDVSDIRATFSEPQRIFNMSGHMPRAISSNRSLAPTPTPDRQRNASKERFTPVSDQKKPIRESQTLSKRRARGGRNQPLVSKRKAGEAEESEDGTAVTNPKRPREMHEEDHPQQNDHVQEPAFAAFPVKITAASSVTHQVVHSTGNTVPQIVNPRKLCVKINRRPYNKWLRSTQERNIEQEGSLPLLGETSETDSAGESMAESMLQSQVESEPVIQPLPASDPDSCPAQASDVQVRESSAQLAPIAASVSPAVNDSSTSTALDITPENAHTAKTTLKTGICSLTEQHLPDDPTLLESSKNVAEPRKLQTFQAKCLPVPIPEVKSEPEDIMDEHSPNEPMPMVAAAPATPQPHAITEDPGPLTIQVNTLGVSTSSRPPELNSIPSASDPDGNPNTIGQTKMFSFLYPKRYKQAYDDVGLDFCCPNLDGPMRAIDFTRLHSKAEVPVLEVPQFLVITTKFISKADKNMPSKVRAKLELLGRSKERDSRKLTPTATTPTGDPAGPSSFSPAPASVGPATQPFPSIIQNLLSAPIPAPSPFNHPTTVDPSTSTPVVPGSSSSTTISATLDSISKQLPRGTKLIKKSVQQVTTIPSLAGTSMVLNASPSFIQLPPICPNDKQRVELQARVQMFDLVLQTLSRRAANLSVAERQRTIEEIVRTSSLMAIDVDVGTKLLENYVHYLNKATSAMTPLTPAQINSSLGASTSSSLSKSIASSDTPQQGKKIPAAHVQQRSSLPATTMPLYDADRNTIGFPYSCSKSTAGRKSSYAANSTPVRASTSQAAAAALGKVQPRSTLGIPKSVREDASQFVNLNTTVCMPAPRTNAKKKTGTSGPLKSINSSPAVQKPALCKQKTAPARTLAKSTARAKSTASLSAVLGETPADEFVSPAGMSLSTTGNPNVFIISHAGQQEESILPDSNSSVGHMETTEIKGELDDSAEIII
ncbi:uncharacterized protein LOC117137609 isoform X2 [Drosophila mauritiana]|uniref:Uncharacterized protein LOC117137609 isoform X2 n=1 Tax=Drosophila mauritiana TaxID=7226 RepID=A0A6P8JH44_DROMA|nr:uncharacterized protein LOC117137609 isoform X2 [Drosophila mauritiana]